LHFLMSEPIRKSKQSADEKEKRNAIFEPEISITNQQSEA
jgi:hypothetical protein